MVDVQDAAGEQLIEDRLEQEDQRAAVDAHAIRLAHRDRADVRIDLDRVSQLAQLAVDHRSHHRRFAGFGELVQEAPHLGAARPAQDAPIRQVDFDRRAGRNQLDLGVFL